MADFDAFTTPSARRDVLRTIAPDRSTVTRFHGELLEIFKREMAFRAERDGSGDEYEDNCYEQLYWCALLLYLIGDSNDVPLMWEAKNISMDTFFGLDAQFLVGAGVNETIRSLLATGNNEIADYLISLESAHHFDYLREWEQGQVGYYYSVRDSHSGY